MFYRSIAFVVFHASSCFAGLAPESVAVVANGDSWASLTVANEYVYLRHIPPNNVIVLKGLTSFDLIDVDRFRSEILEPVMSALDERGIREQIDCITYSVDLPYSVSVQRDIGGNPFPQVITPVASTNGLTYLVEAVLRKDAAEYLRLDVNRYCRRTLPLVTGEALTAGERAEYQRGMTLYDAKKYDEAAKVIGSLTRVKRTDPGMLYNLACCLALANKPDDAIRSLKNAVAHGWRNHGQTTSDPDMKILQDREDFKKLVAEMKASKIEVQPVCGFRSNITWAEDGQPGTDGPRYILSTMLGITSGRGNSVAETLASLKRSASADGTVPKGTIYFLKNGDVRSTTRDWAFPFAMEQLRSCGVSCVTEDGVLPQNHKDVAGTVVGIADFKWTDSRSIIQPGAICEHLTSCGGMIGERDGQTPCTEWIRAGAAGTSGAVTEPFALQEKFPTAFMHLFYAQGGTLAEAFYQAINGPYQLLVIGDPLCRPWGRDSQITIPGISAGTTIRGKFELLPAVENSAGAVGDFVLFVDGREIAAAAPGTPLVLDSAKFDDGDHTLVTIARHKDGVQSVSRVEHAVKFSTHKKSVKVVNKPASKIEFGKLVAIELESPGASNIQVMHLGREVAKVSGAKGRVEIDTAALGIGHVSLIAIANFGTSQEHARAIVANTEIFPPNTIPPATVKAGSKFEKGLAVSVKGSADVEVKDTYSADWLAKSGIENGESFVAQGYFCAEADLYQLQLRTNLEIKTEIDGVEVMAVDDDAWHYAPAKLAAGRHLLRLTGKGASGAFCDLRFGAAGTAHPSEAKFSHVTK